MQSQVHARLPLRSLPHPWCHLCLPQPCHPWRQPNPSGKLVDIGGNCTQQEISSMQGSKQRREEKTGAAEEILVGYPVDSSELCHDVISAGSATTIMDPTEDWSILWLTRILTYRNHFVWLWRYCENKTNTVWFCSSKFLILLPRKNDNSGMAEQHDTPQPVLDRIFSPFSLAIRPFFEYRDEMEVSTRLSNDQKIKVVPWWDFSQSKCLQAHQKSLFLQATAQIHLCNYRICAYIHLWTRTLADSCIIMCVYRIIYSIYF